MTVDFPSPTASLTFSFHFFITKEFSHKMIIDAEHSWLHLQATLPLLA